MTKVKSIIVFDNIEWSFIHPLEESDKGNPTKD